MMDGGAQAATRRLRMADLVERTGVSAQTIRYYVNEGLLPKPRKSARNMAWYSDAHVEQISLIRALQKEHFLPLRAIRAALHESDDYPLTLHQRGLIALARQRFESRRRNAPAAGSVEEIAADAGVSKQELRELRDYGLLSKDEKDAAGDAAILRLWAHMRDNGLGPSGIRPRDLAVAHDVVDLLFDRELQLFAERLRDLPATQVDAVLNEVVPSIARLIGVLNERRIADFASRFSHDQSAGPEEDQ